MPLSALAAWKLSTKFYCFYIVYYALPELRVCPKITMMTQFRNQILILMSNFKSNKKHIVESSLVVLHLGYLGKNIFEQCGKLEKLYVYQLNLSMQHGFDASQEKACPSHFIQNESSGLLKLLFLLSQDRSASKEANEFVYY